MHTPHFVLTGFPKLVSPKARSDKTLFGPIKANNRSFWIVYNGQISLEITATSCVSKIVSLVLDTADALATVLIDI